MPDMKVKKLSVFGIKWTAVLYKPANYKISKTRKYKMILGKLKTWSMILWRIPISAGT